MTVAEAHLTGEPSSGGPLLIWGSAVLAALALHAGLVAWALQAPPAAPAAPSAPAAVMLELAPEPVSPELAEPEIAEESFDAPEIATAQPEPMALPDIPTPLDPPPLALPETLSSPVADEAPVAEMPPVVLPEPEVAVARPRARPEVLPRPEQPEPEPEPQRAERKPTPEPPAPEPPSQAARKAAVAAPPAEKAAAAQTSRGASGSASPAKWQSQLMAHLERRKRYPAASRGRREEGVALVRFSIDDQGNVLSVRLARSSGHPALDEEVIALVRRASPVPAPPPGAPHEITAPVQFRIR